MEKVNQKRTVELTSVLSRSWSVLKQTYGSLSKVMFLHVLIIAPLQWLLSSNLTLISEFYASSPETFLLLVALLTIGGFAFSLLMKKFFLAAVRQPRIVRQHPWEALKYAFTDGLLKRILYLFGYVSVLLLVPVLPAALFLIYFFNNPGQPFAIAAMIILSYTAPLIIAVVFVLLDSISFLFPYIVQDTLSEDNIRKPLSFLSCLRKSRQLTKGSKSKYLFLIYGFHAWIGIISIQYIFPVLGYSFASSDILLTIFVLFTYLIPSLLRQIFMAVWADELMARDQSIVNYGD